MNKWYPIELCEGLESYYGKRTADLLLKVDDFFYNIFSDEYLIIKILFAYSQGTLDNEIVDKVFSKLEPELVQAVKDIESGSISLIHENDYIEFTIMEDDEFKEWNDVLDRYGINKKDVINGYINDFNEDVYIEEINSVLCCFG